MKNFNLGDDEEEENEEKDADGNHRNHDNHAGGSAGSGGGGNVSNFMPGGPTAETQGNASGSGVTGTSQPAGLPFTGYGHSVVPPKISALPDDQDTSSTAQASEIAPVAVSSPVPLTSKEGSLNNTNLPETQKMEASNRDNSMCMGSIENQSQTVSRHSTPQTVLTTGVGSTSSLVGAIHASVSTPTTVLASTNTTTATSASSPFTRHPLSTSKSTHPSNSNNDSSSSIAKNVRNSPISDPINHTAPNSVIETVDSIVNKSVSDIVAKEASTTVTTEMDASTTTTHPNNPTTDISQQDKNSALKEEEDSNHSSDSDGPATTIGSHAMNMIMSEYDPQKGQPITASAAMNMIKDQYNNKLVDLKLSSSPLPSTTSIKAESKPEGKVKNLARNESTLNHSAVNMVKFESQSSKGLLSNPTGPHASESSVPSFVKKEEKNFKHVNTLEGDIKPMAPGPPQPLIPMTKEEPKEVETARHEEPMDTNDRKYPIASRVPVQNHDTSSQQPSPKPETPDSSETNDQTASENPEGEILLHSSLVSRPSPTAVKSPAAQMAGAGTPFGLLGAYRPYVAGVPGMQLARMPVLGSQAMLASPAGMLAHPGLMAGMPFTAASAIPAAAHAGIPHMASPFAMAGGVRYAAPPAAYMSATPMMHAVPTAATGPYSHLGVPGHDPYLQLATMGMAVPGAAAAPIAATPSAATAIYPQLQVAQAPAAPQFAMISAPRIPYQGFLPRPPT